MRCDGAVDVCASTFCKAPGPSLGAAGHPCRPFWRFLPQWWGRRNSHAAAFPARAGGRSRSCGARPVGRGGENSGGVLPVVGCAICGAEGGAGTGCPGVGGKARLKRLRALTGRPRRAWRERTARGCGLRKREGRQAQGLPPKKELSRKCRSPLLFHPPLRQGGDLRPFTAFPGRSKIGGMASTETDPESFFESVGKSTGVAHTTG